MRLKYTYWKEDDWFAGFLDEFPGWWTQRKDISELEEMLLDLYDLCDDEESINSAKSMEKVNDNKDIVEGALHGILKIPVAVPA